MASDNVADVVTDVTMGKYPVSIGTSIPLEVLFGISELIPATNPPPYVKYKHILINVRTLIRNIYGAVAKELKAEYPAQSYLDRLLAELSNLPAVVENQSAGQTGVIFYLSNHRDIAKHYPKAILKVVKESAYGRRHQEAIEQYCVAQITSMAIAGSVPVSLVDIKLPRVGEASVIITHQPIDLLSYVNSRDIDLIESHTGVIKDRYKWYTKLNGKGLETIPFSNWSIQFFGDGKHFAGYPPKHRKMVVDFSIANRWNQSTTLDLIRMQLARFPDKDIAKAIKSLM